jgi:sensor c-di-GMP phosphodiesterase-like protein
MAASVAVFIAGAHLAASALIDTLRTKQIRELSEVALRRSEVAVDYGIVTLNELLKRGSNNCNTSALQAVRLLVYRRSAVKDIRIVSPDGAVLCSAYSETLEFDKNWPSRAEMLPAHDGTTLLFRVEQFYGVALGVLRGSDADGHLVAIVGMSADLLDIMPAELRDHSEILLELSDGRAVADHVPVGQGARPSDVTSFVKASSRFPLRTTIRVDTSALERWNNEPYLPIMILGTALGLAFGFLLATVTGRPKNPVAELDRALAAGEFEPFLQPVFNLVTGGIVGCEVLARWRQSDGRVLPPARFIQLAESSGRIEPITWQILSATLIALQPRLKEDKRFQVYVNFVPRHIMAPGFLDKLKETVAVARLSARQLVIEITERDEIENLERAASVIAELRELGFKVAIDDVGVGHSGLSQVQRLGANILKIDKFFVDSVARDSTANAVVRMLVSLAGELKMKIHAEGIETDEQMSALIACGVEEGQGYIVSRPLPVADFIAFMDGRSEPIATTEGMKRPRVA